MSITTTSNINIEIVGLLLDKSLSLIINPCQPEQLFKNTVLFLPSKTILPDNEIVYDFKVLFQVKPKPLIVILLDNSILSFYWVISYWIIIFINTVKRTI